jgi:DNA-binding response OmpR family regulator
MLTVMGQLDDPTLDDQAIRTHVRERMEGFEAGAADFLSKPIKAKELLDRVRTSLWFDNFPVDSPEADREERETALAAQRSGL